MSRISHKRFREDGAAAIEFALVAVVLIMLLFGIIQFGYTFYEYIQVAHAAREGVRWAALGAPNEVIPRAQAAAPGLDPARLTITVENDADNYAVRVTARYVRTELTPIPGVALPATITSVAEQRVE